MVYVILSPVFTTILKRYGKRSKAIITENATSWGYHRYGKNEYLYEFIVEDETYTGNYKTLF